jgi:secondary thiamine-phosphate synthase enzyme
MKIVELTLKSRQRCEMIDISAAVAKILRDNPMAEGTISLFTPHTTAAITINENADPDVRHDLLSALAKLVPQDPAFKHAEGNSDAHLKSSLIGAGQTLLVEDGKLQIGTWQGIYFCEFDGPRRRRVQIKLCPDID